MLISAAMSRNIHVTFNSVSKNAAKAGERKEMITFNFVFSIYWFHMVFGKKTIQVFTIPSILLSQREKKELGAFHSFIHEMIKKISIDKHFIAVAVHKYFPYVKLNTSEFVQSEYVTVILGCF